MISKAFRTFFLQSNSLPRFMFSRSQKHKEMLSELNKLDQFNENVKEKYLKNQNYSDMDIQHIKQKISDEYENEADKLFNDESILNQMRSDMFDNEEIKTRKEQIQQSQQPRQMEPLEKYFANLTDKEFLKRAREFQQDISLSRFPEPEKRSQSISRDYANYSSYEKNTAVYKDMREEWEEYPEEIYQGKRILNFIKNLDNNVMEKKDLQQQMEQIKIDNPEMSEKEIEELHFQNEAQKIQKEKEFKNRFDLGDSEFDKDLSQFNKPTRLSPMAKTDIFRLYCQGWSVRDISSRYGIIPERVKAVVWCQQKLYFEVIPNVDLTTIKAGMQREIEYNQEYPYQDYGIDLEEMARRNRGVLTPSFTKQKELDIKAFESTEKNKEYRVQKHLRKKVRTKFLTTGFIGKHEKGYYLKDWVVNYGRGSDKVSTMFKRIVTQSHRPESLPKKVQKKLAQGPRIASQGYGHN